MDYWTSVLLLVVFAVETQDTLGQDSKNLIVLHTSNFRSNFLAEKTGKNESRYGIARMITYTREQLNSNKDATIYIDAMDWAEGSILFSIFKMEILTAFVHMLPVDVLTLGETEMRQGYNKPERLTNFVGYIMGICNKSIVSSNIVIPDENEISKCVRNHTIIERGGLRIGVVSLLERKLVPKSFGGIQVKSGAIVVDIIAKYLLRKVDIIIMVGHITRKVLQRMGIPYAVKLLIGGHGDVLFYNGNPPSGDLVSGKYPEIKLPGIPLVYAGSYGKYVGRINIEIYSNGTIGNCAGNPVHMDETIIEDEDALNMVKNFQERIDKRLLKPLGKSRVVLDTNCLKEECSFGNVIVDSFVEYKANLYHGKYWTDTPIAFLNSGAIKSNIYAMVLENRTVTEAHLLGAMPYNNQLVTLELNGTVLRSIMEHSVYDMTEEGQEHFLQVSGLRVVYDLSRKVTKIESLRVRCGKCTVPEYLGVKEDDANIYTVVTTDYIANGGDGFTMIKNQHLDLRFERIAARDAVMNYIKYYKVIQTGTDERIVIKKKKIEEGRSVTGIAVSHRSNINFYYYSCTAYILLNIKLK